MTMLNNKNFKQKHNLIYKKTKKIQKNLTVIISLNFFLQNSYYVLYLYCKCVCFFFILINNIF